MAACLRAAWAEWTCKKVHRWPMVAVDGGVGVGCRRFYFCPPRKRYRICHQQSVVFRHWFRGSRHAPCMARVSKDAEQDPLFRATPRAPLYAGLIFFCRQKAARRRLLRLRSLPVLRTQQVDCGLSAETRAQRARTAPGVSMLGQPTVTCDVQRVFSSLQALGAISMKAMASASSDIHVCEFRRFAGTPP